MVKKTHRSKKTGVKFGPYILLRSLIKIIIVFMTLFLLIRGLVLDHNIINNYAFIIKFFSILIPSSVFANYVGVNTYNWSATRPERLWRLFIVICSCVLGCIVGLLFYRFIAKYLLDLLGIFFVVIFLLGGLAISALGISASTATAMAYLGDRSYDEIRTSGKLSDYALRNFDYATGRAIQQEAYRRELLEIEKWKNMFK